jgi:hypothetical protein
MPPAGFIISSSGGDGTVVTNTHIIADAIAGDSAAGAAILCTLQDGRSFPAQLVNFDWCAPYTAPQCPFPLLWHLWLHIDTQTQHSVVYCYSPLQHRSVHDSQRAVHKQQR